MSRLSAAVVFLFAFVLPAFGGRIAPGLQEYLETVGPGEKIPVMVDFSGGPDLQALGSADRPVERAAMVENLKETAKRIQSPVRNLLGRRGQRFRDLWIINSLAVHADPTLVMALSELPEVQNIRLDKVVRAGEPTLSQTFSAGWNLQAVGAPDLWAEGFTGEGTVVAVLDSGADLQHAAIGANWRGGPDDWFNPYAEQCDTLICTSCESNGLFPCDDETGDEQGHGTAVTGVLVGGEIDGEPIGVAPGAEWIAAKIFRDDGTANQSFIHQAFQWILDHPEPPDLVNGSWGFENGPGDCDLEYIQDIQALRNAGIGVVFSAGNTGPDPASGISPGNYPETLAAGSIGTVSSLFEISPFSARGPSACDGSVYPDVVAPGFHIRTADVTMDGLAPEAVEIVSGTSFAAPHVAGVLALLGEAFPDISMAGLAKAVIQSADDLGEAGLDNSYGSGLVNALSAYNLLMEIPDISVHDPIAPENDLHLDFGSVSPGGEVEETVVVRNAGSGILEIHDIDVSALGPPFFLVSDNCTDIALGEDDSCTITFRFAPPAHEAFQGEIRIRSNDHDEGDVLLSVSGTGNSPPGRPSLISPEDQASGLREPVVFQWIHPNDPDNDFVSDTLLLSKLGDFSDRIPIAGGTIKAQNTRFTAGAGSLMSLLGVVGMSCSRNRRRMGMIIAVAGLGLLVACGGGGDGGGGEGEDMGIVVERTVTELESDTVYHWKVVSEDFLGGTSESDVRSFRTQ